VDIARPQHFLAGSDSPVIMDGAAEPAICGASFENFGHRLVAG